MNTITGGASVAEAGTGQQKKALRFITNHGQPHTKRRRISSARGHNGRAYLNLRITALIPPIVFCLPPPCVTCRKRKTGCSGERPTCKTCETNNQVCGGYVTEPSHSSKQTLSNDVNRSGTGGNVDRERHPKHSPPDCSPDSFASKRTSPVTHHSPRQPPDTVRLSPPTLPVGFKKETENRLSDPPPHDPSSQADQSASHAKSPSLGLNRNRMPYFRYFGPTAIMPGFKQMIVKVKEHRPGGGAASSSDPGILSPFGDGGANHPTGTHQMHPPTPSQMISDIRTPLAIPFYDNSRMPPSELITHLCSTFFDHLGCNFPFLQKDRFMRDLEIKEVDAILVDSVCAMAARFSQHPMLRNSHVNDEGQMEKHRIPPSEYGHVFAQRAKSAIIDTFSCPSVGAVQAALLLAYDEFGRNRDSGLWMYLGIAIRMAQDLGMQNINGLRYEGCDGPTPKSVKLESSQALIEEDKSGRAALATPTEKEPESQAIQEQRANERERLDTFWAVFFLDRVISSGTGRPVTLNDSDIEVAFPSMETCMPGTDWPTPFAALIRVIHLYGQVTDVLNRIKETTQMTTDVPKQLTAVETQLTQIYQGLSPKLHFTASNFQRYVKASQGGTFVLLHFWFHTLIVLLHQPTLLHTFEGKIQQLVSNSRELSMSSAKTIADILAFAELMDAKAALGNPFISQPVYIAGCAFLNETMIHTTSSNPQSRNVSPPPTSAGVSSEPRSATASNSDGNPTPPIMTRAGNPNCRGDGKQLPKHTLLATAATQNYQRCHRALENLEYYWAGAKYILTVLDQKAKGVGEPVLYTKEEEVCALETPSREPAFTSPGWRRKTSWENNVTNSQDATSTWGPVPGPSHLPPNLVGSSPNLPNVNMDMTNGTMNSPSSSLALLYPNSAANGINTTTANQARQPRHAHANSQSSTAFTDPNRPSPSDSYTDSPQNPYGESTGQPGYGRGIDAGVTYRQNMVPWGNHPNPADAQTRSQNKATSAPGGRYTGPMNPQAFSPSTRQPGLYRNDSQESQYPQARTGAVAPMNFPPGGGAPEVSHFGDMTIESQDIDMSTLGNEMMPWLEYLPQDFLNNFDVADGNMYPHQQLSPNSTGQPG
ncbi:MAG: hypothetical protein M1822_009308 [Bathelium mastoideum]|nr:MAG: hypothetical protein M1822_009308 [Bathelium mastoideum]